MVAIQVKKAQFDDIRAQLVEDKEEHLVGLDKDVEQAIAAGDSAKAAGLIELREQLLNTIEAEELELRFLGNEIGERFRQADIIGARIISIGKGNRAQAEVKIAARNGQTVVRHMHLIGGRDRYNNRYAV